MLSYEELIGSLARNQQRLLAKRIVQQRRRLPSALNEQALFTRSSPHGDLSDGSFHSPCNRIASYYSPQASEAAAVLFEDFTGRGTARRASHSPTQARSIHQPCQRGCAATTHSADAHLSTLRPEQLTQFAEAYMRWCFYLEAGISTKHIAPFRQQWLSHVLDLVPSEHHFRLPESHYAQLINEAIEETKADYVYAMRSAIMMYIMRAPVERIRLGLEPLTPFMNVLDPAQQRRASLANNAVQETQASQRVIMAQADLACTLQILSVNAVELAALWHDGGFKDQLLVDTQSHSFVAKLPVVAEDFEALQLECQERVKASLWTHWLPRSAEIFRTMPPICINADAAAYYRSIATLQSNQLRELVQRSIDAYVALFDAHDTGAAAITSICVCRACNIVAIACRVPLLVSFTQSALLPRFDPFTPRHAKANICVITCQAWTLQQWWTAEAMQSLQV
jgi:dynein heavy chain, axonemal